ncbi:MAG TPA: polysaccharide deacetylase family protein, partial [Thermomicrobiales bacterium]|nr:polysaccharide deacetylase family protein [Thermomicrobiales bacterium]
MKRSGRVDGALRVVVVIASLLGLMLAAGVRGTPVVETARAADVITIRRFETDEKVYALTFDAGSDRGYAVKILDTLKANGIHATFGMTGVWAQANPDLLQRMVTEGHQLLNHSWDHPSFNTLTTAQRTDQLKRTEDIVRQTTGVELRPWFRPPYGDYNDSVLSDLSADGYTYNVLWTTDSLGWNGLDAAGIIQRVVDGAVPGGIGLFHVGAASQDAEALQGIIDRLRQRGYRFATIAELAGTGERYFPETGHTVAGNFLKYWNQFGGLELFGYPISDAFEWNGMTVQYFERVRMEHQPGMWPARYDILLGRLGSELTADRVNEQPFQRVTGSANANCDYYAETDHYLCYGFRDYWRKHGGL